MTYSLESQVQSNYNHFSPPHPLPSRKFSLFNGNILGELLKAVSSKQNMLLFFLFKWGKGEFKAVSKQTLHDFFFFEKQLYYLGYELGGQYKNCNEQYK
jgi:hypothetical protein